MKSILCLLISFLLLNEINAQCESPYFRFTGTSIKDVSLIDTSNILAVGDNGYIIKSVDGGKSWKNIQTFNPYSLRAVQLNADSVGYTVGENKTILKTEDQGQHWFPLVSGIPSVYPFVSSSFNDLYFFNNERGCVVGDNGIFISTIDGGKSWNFVQLNSSESLKSITFIDDSTGFICSANGVFFKTQNGGRTWVESTLGSNLSGSYRKIKFIDNSTGFIIGASGLCLKTTDAGITWTKINTPTSGTYYDIFFVDALKGFIVGAYTYGVILQTDDGGNTWNDINNYPGQLGVYYSINAEPGKKKILIAGGGGSGLPSGYGRNILSTTDAGTTYTTLSGNGKKKYNDVFFLNDSTGYITGEGAVALKTNDFGESWKPLHYVPALVGGNAAKKIFFLDTLHGFASTDNIYKTSDGGTTWNITTIPGMLTQYNAEQMYFMDTLKGLVQNSGTIYKTIDGGTTWTNVATTSSFYTGLAVTPNGNAFAVSNNGKLDVSTNEGSTWVPFNLNTTKKLTSVYFYNNTTGFIGTGDTTIFKTTDGGNSWISINTGIPDLQVRSLFFTDDSIGYMIAANTSGTGSIYNTKNGGISWSRIPQEAQNFSKLAGYKTVYLGAADGLILKTDKLQKPLIPGYISGTGKGCMNDQSSFTSGFMSNVNYNWVLSTGGINVSNANMDTAFWNSTGIHTLSLTVSNACGVSAPRQFTTEVILFQPTITVVDSVLTATEGASYQWYRDGVSVSAGLGGRSRSLTGRVSGSYTVDVKSYYGCIVKSPAVRFLAFVSKTLCPGANISFTSNKLGSSYQWQRNDGSGFVNITDDSIYAGTNTMTLQLTGIPSSWYGYKFKCLTLYESSDIYTLQFADSWTGAVNAAWENPANWSCGKVPDANTDVIIKSGTLNINSDVTVRKLTLNSTVQLTVQPGNTLTVTH